MVQVAQAEGPAGFYRGFGAVLAGVVPATMVYYAAYETSKKLVPEEWGALKGPTVGLMTQLAAGLAFTPVDIIKERMQVAKLCLAAFLCSHIVSKFAQHFHVIRKPITHTSR